MALRLIGDIHCNTERYIQAIGTATETIQLGDFSTEDDFDLDFGIKQGGDHYILLGNHDNYQTVMDSNGFSANRCGSAGKYNLVGHGRIGTSAGNVFYVSGAESPDRLRRTEGHDWWREEELTFSQARECLDEWETLSGDNPINIVVSHDCPSRVAQMMHGDDKPTFTRQLLQEMWEIHKPSLWVFGHHHRNEIIHLEGTTFRCLDEGEFIDIYP